MEKHHPKKYYGQHFLMDHNIAQKICKSLLLSGEKYKTIIEVGPGKGMLTEHLTQNKNINYYGIEVDRDLLKDLKEHFQKPNIHFINKDFLTLDFNIFQAKNIGIIGNFPYNISGPIIFKILENKSIIVEVVGMFQREFAERLVAKPNTKSYGILSVLIDASFEITKIFNVGKKVFNPQPKVESSVIRMVLKQTESKYADSGLFYKIVKLAFNQRRKMLRNALSMFKPKFSSEITPFLNLRAENLSTEDFLLLTKVFQEK